MSLSSSGSLFVFFFKKKTAYEMRISDWSSDVCSSDLRFRRPRRRLCVRPPEHAGNETVRNQSFMSHFVSAAETATAGGSGRPGPLPKPFGDDIFRAPDRKSVV